MKKILLLLSILITACGSESPNRNCQPEIDAMHAQYGQQQAADDFYKDGKHVMIAHYFRLGKSFTFIEDGKSCQTGVSTYAPIRKAIAELFDNYSGGEK